MDNRDSIFLKLRGLRFSRYLAFMETSFDNLVCFRRVPVDVYFFNESNPFNKMLLNGLVSIKYLSALSLILQSKMASTKFYFVWGSGFNVCINRKARCVCNTHFLVVFVSLELVK